MKIQRKILLPAVLVIAGVLLASLLLFLSVRLSEGDETPLNAVPDNTALILKINRPGSFWEELNRSNQIWNSLSYYPGIRDVRSELFMFDSISRKNSQVGALLRKYNLVVTLSLSGRTRFGVVFLTQAPGNDFGGLAGDFTKELFGDSCILTKSPYASTTIYRLQKGEKSAPFFFAQVKGVFIGSFLADLVKKSIDRLMFSKPAFQSAGFSHVELPENKRADATLLINYRLLAFALSKISPASSHPSLVRLASLASWTGLNVTVKKDEIDLEGVTLAEDTTFNYLNMFASQEPQSHEIALLIPGNTAWLACFGWSDMASFFDKTELKNRQDELEAGENSPLTRMNERFRLNLSDFFLPWIGSQAAVFSLEGQGLKEGPTTFAAFQVRDSVLAYSLMDSLCRRMDLKADSLRYKGYRITGYHFQDILQNLFGSLFENAGQGWCTYIKRHLVFGRDPIALKKLIDSYISGFSLDKDQAWMGMAAKMPARSNIMLYFSASNAGGMLPGIISENLRTSLALWLDSLKKFQPLCIQFTAGEGFFRTHMLLGFTPSLQKESTLRWQTRLDSTVVGSPQILNTLWKSDPAIAVRDTLNNLYLFGADGILRWRMHFMGRMLSDLKPARMPGTDTLFYFFNTDSHLYLIRSDGTAARNFPMRFPMPATNALCLLNADRRGDYRIFIAFRDQRVYQFDLQGKSVTSWERPHMKTIITRPVQYIVSNNKDFLFIRDTLGTLMITDRQGRSRIRVGPMFKPAPNSSFYPVNLAQKGIFVTTGNTGKLIFIQENGKTLEISLGTFTQKYWFFNENIMGSVVPEYIFVDQHKISYYNRSNNLIYSYLFRRELSHAPFVIRDRENYISRIGVTIPETGEIFLFDSKGYFPLDPSIYGTTPFDLGKLEDDGTMNLVIGAGSWLRTYRVVERKP
jgi:hypothetical protein